MNVLRGAQTSLFSLSIGATYGFDLPPGRGSLTPLLALNYASANHTPGSGHFSYPGFGWDLLGADSVYMPPGDPNLNKKTLSLQGRTYTLREGASGWYALEDPFLKITASNVSHYTPRTWNVWTQDGTKYTFDADLEMGTYYWKLCNTGDVGRRYVRIPLRSVQDTSGNTINFTWESETDNNVPYNCLVDPSSLPTNQFKRATRLTEINYNNDKVRVVLAYADRVDRPDSYNCCVWPFYTGKRVTGVTVQVRDMGAGDWKTVRSYALGQFNGGTTHPSQMVLNLDWIEERSANGSALPRTNFTYSDTAFANQNAFGAMTSASNGYGGQVVFVSDHRWGNEANAHIVSSRTEKYGVTDLADQTWSYSGINWDESGGEEQARGFKEVDITQPDVAVEKHYFLTIDNDLANSLKAGREWKRGVWSGSSELARTETDWVASTQSLPVSPPSNPPPELVPRFVYAAQARTYETNKGVARVDYLYEPARQGGTQWGNATQMEERGWSGSSWSSLPVRTTYSWYYPNATNAITSKLARSELYKVCNGCANGAIVSQRLLFYDQNSPGNYQAPPTQGLLRFDETGLSSLIRTTEYQYWPNGNLRKVIDANDHDVETFYDSQFQVFPVCVRNIWGWTTKQRYFGVPGSGDPEPAWSVCDNTVSGSTLATSGAFFGQLQEERDPNDIATSYSYDIFGRPAATVRSGDSTSNPTERYGYFNYGGVSSPFWMKTEQRDNASGAATYLKTRTFYDGFGRMIQTQAEAASATQSIVSNTRYNGLDQVVQRSLPYFYNAALGSYRSPNWGQPDIQTSYDALGRVTQVINPDNTATTSSYRYVLANREVGVVDAMHRQQIQEIDFLGRLVRAKQYQNPVSGTVPDWGVTVYAAASYEYDVADQMTGVTGADGSVTTITYDALGRKTSMTDPDMGGWSYSYDDVGNLKVQTDARGQTVCFYYDALNRLMGKHYRNDTICPTWNSDPSLAARYYYDEDPALYGESKGRRTRAVAYPSGPANLTNTISWKYDQRGRITKDTRTIDGAPYATNYSYDALDRVTWMQYPDNEGITMGYSAQGQVNKLSTGSSDYLSDATFNARGQATCYRYGQVRQTRLNYRDSSDLRLDSIVSGATGQGTTGSCSEASGNATQNLVYTYDLAGNVTSILDNNNGPQTQTFQYDALDRLTRGYTSGGTGGEYDESYSYNNAGNRTGKLQWFQWINTYGKQAADCPNGSLVKPHALVSANGYIYANSYCYDQNGNMVRRRFVEMGLPTLLPRAPDGDSSDQAPDTDLIDTYTLTYDAENRFTAISGGGMISDPVNANFVYDADGNRVKATFNGTSTIYVGNHYERTGNALIKYYYASGRRIAMRTGGVTYYLFPDHLGGTHITASSVNGAELGKLLYKPWGETRVNSGTPLTTWRFTGQREDATIGLYYYNARFYDPALGRFTQPDTIVPNPGDPQSLNRYSYVLNNPARYTDPTGHLTEEELQTLLGNDYDTLMALWRQYDQYWVAILEAIQGGGNLQASLLGAIELHFEGSGKDIRTNVYNGSFSKQLQDWQGKGAYRVQNPGMSDEQARVMRDTIFNQQEIPNMNMLLEPVFDYRRRIEGNIRPTYLGARMVGQKLGEFQYTSTIYEGVRGLGASDGVASLASLGGQGALLLANPAVEAGVLVVDLTVSIGKAYRSPMDYSNGWPGYIDINPSIGLDRLTY